MEQNKVFRVFGYDTFIFLFLLSLYATVLWFAPTNIYVMWIAWFFLCINLFWGLSLFMTRKDFKECTYPASLYLLSKLDYLSRIIFHGIIVYLWIRAGFIFAGLFYGYIGILSTDLITARTDKYLAGDFDNN